MICMYVDKENAAVKLSSGAIANISVNELRLANSEDYDVMERVHMAEMLDVETLCEIITRKLASIVDE